MAKIDLPYTNDENTGFKDKLLKNKSGLTEGDILQAWVFRRLDIFRFKGENDIVESDLPAIRSELQSRISSFFKEQLGFFIK